MANLCSKFYTKEKASLTKDSLPYQHHVTKDIDFLSFFLNYLL